MSHGGEAKAPRRAADCTEQCSSLVHAGRDRLMRTVMLRRGQRDFERLAMRSAFVVGIVSDEEENKIEIMLDPVRAPCALTHTLKILFMLHTVA